MRSLIIALTTILASASALAQGTINFNNRVTGQVDAPITIVDTGFGAFPGNQAQLYRVTGTAGAQTYTPIGQATTFRTPTAANPLLAAYVNPIASMVVDGVAPGSAITVVLRAWIGPNYDSASWFGQTSAITITLGGDIPGAPPAVPANLVGLQGFTIPEPSTIAMGLVGTAAFLFRRRS